MATWGLADGRVTITPIEAIEPDTLELLEADADQVLTYLCVEQS